MSPKALSEYGSVTHSVEHVIAMLLRVNIMQLTALNLYMYTCIRYHIQLPYKDYGSTGSVAYESGILVLELMKMYSN